MKDNLDDVVEHVEETTVEQDLEEAKRHFALKNWSQAADLYGEVLETLREKYEEENPLFAPVLHRYGHALLEHAIATSGALGGSGGGEGDRNSRAHDSQVSKTVASARAEENSSKKAEKAIAEGKSASCLICLYITDTDGQ